MFSSPEPLSALQPLLPNGWTGVLAAMGLTFIAFEGYEIIVQTGEEAIDPVRTLPFIPHGRVLLLFAGLASTASALNATIYSSSRIAFALGRGGDLPQQLARVHPRHHTPYLAIGTTGAVILVMISTLRLKEVAVSADIMFLFLYFIVCTTVLVLRRKWPHRERPFRVPFCPLTPLIGIVAGVGFSIILFRVSRTAWITVCIWLVVGLVIYLSWHCRNSSPPNAPGKPAK